MPRVLVNRLEAAFLERCIIDLASDIVDQFKRIRLGGGERNGIDNGQMSAVRKRVHRADLLVDVSIRGIQDAERRFAPNNERQSRAHAVGSYQAPLDIVPDDELRECLACTPPDRHGIRITGGQGIRDSFVKESPISCNTLVSDVAANTMGWLIGLRSETREAEEQQPKCDIRSVDGSPHTCLPVTNSKKKDQNVKRAPTVGARLLS